MKLACEFLIGALFVRANYSNWSMALKRFCQSLVLQLSTSVFISSTRFRSTGFDTEVVRLLNVFAVPSKPDEEP